MIEIIFIDVDGTLKDECGQIPNSMTHVISKCNEKNIVLCLCTGRSIGTIQEDVKKLPIQNVIAGGGNYISIDSEIIFQDSFSRHEMECFLKDESVKNYAFALESNEEIFMNKAAEEIFLTMNRKYVYEMSLEQRQYYQENENLVYRDNIKEFNAKQYPIHKICIWCEECQFNEVSQHITQYQIVQKNKWEDLYYYELVKVGCDKGSGVEKVLEHFHIPKANSVAFGNGKNDIDMFMACGTSIAMGDSDEELKHYATSICETAQEHGIYKELKRMKILGGMMYE